VALSGKGELTRECELAEPGGPCKMRLAHRPLKKPSSFMPEHFFQLAADHSAIPAEKERRLGGMKNAVEYVVEGEGESTRTPKRRRPRYAK
jgi:hypothetical protein